MPTLPRRPFQPGRPVSTPWRRPPEDRAVDFDRHTQRWIRWLRGCSLPLPHIAELLSLDLGALDTFANRNGSPVPTGPPRRSSKPAAILGQTGCKVRVLQSLGYPVPTIARVLDVELEALEDFLTRLSPIRRAALVRPRSRPEHARIRPPRRRPDRSPAPPVGWVDRDDVGPDGRPIVLVRIEPPAVELDDQVEPKLPAAPPAPAGSAPWVGSAAFAVHPGGRPTVSEKDAVKIRREHAAGASKAALARKYCVVWNTIHRIVTRRTH
jgi:hypothetical protein